MLVYALLSRKLEAAPFGKLLFYLSTFQIVAALVDFGISPAALREISLQPNRLRETVAAARRAKLWLSVAAIPILVAASFGYGERAPTAALLGTALLLAQPLALSAIEEQRNLDYKRLSWARLAGAFLPLPLCYLFFSAGLRGWEWHLAAFVAGSCLTSALLYRPAPPGETNSDDARRLLRFAAPLGLSIAAQQVYFGAGNFFVRALRPEEQLADFAAPFRLFCFALMVPQYLSATALPLLAASWERSLAEHRNLRKKLLVGLLALGVPIGALTAYGAPEIVAIALGPNREGSIEPLRWLAVAGIGVLFGSVAMSGLISQGRNRAALLVSLTACLAALPLHYALSSSFGPSGAAAATAGIEALVAAFAWILLAREEKPAP